MSSWKVVQKMMRGDVIVDGRYVSDRVKFEGMGLYTRIGEI